MGLIGEVWADAGLHVDKVSFAEYASMLKQAENQVKVMSDVSKGLLATVFTGASVALTGVLAYGTSIASSFEDASTTLTTVYGDLDIAKEKFTWLADFAASTPFEFPELLDATVKLKSYGIEAETYMGTIGDASAAMGKTLDETTEAVADAMTGEFERLKEYGIKAIQITSSNYQQMGATMSQVGMTALQYTNKAGEEQYKIVDRNNREMVLSSIQSIWDIEKGFEGAMEARSKTLSGLMSTLKDNLSMGLVDIIGFDIQEMDAQAGSLLGIFKKLIGAAVDLTSGLSDLPESVQAFISVAVVGGTVAFALAGGFFAAELAGLSLEVVMGALGTAVSSVLLPATLIVGTLALVAAGLYVLEEKTGLVSAGFNLLYDMATIVWYGLKGTISEVIDWVSDKIGGFVKVVSGIADALGLGGVADAIGGVFDSIGSRLSSFASDVDTVANNYRESSKEITDASNEAAKGAEEASEAADGAHESWLDSIFGLADGAKEGYGEVTNAAQEVKSSYDKAVEEMNANLQQKKEAQIKVAVGIDTSDFERGVQLVDGSLLILNENGELVHHTLEGVDEKLTDLGDHNFETTRGSISVLVSDGSNIEQTMARADNIVNETGNDVVVLDTSIKNLDGNQLVGLNGQIVTVQDSTQNTFTLVDNLTGNFVELNGQNLSGINGQIQGVDGSTTTATGKVGTWQEYFASINVQPLSTLQGNIMTSGSMVDTSNQKTGNWNTTLERTNASPFGMLLGNLITSGANVDSDNTKTNTWNSTLGRTNSSPFATLHGNLTTAGKNVDSVNTKTSTANITLGKMGSMSFSTTLSGLSGVYNKLVDIYDQAKTTISKLLEIGKTSGSGSDKSSVYGYTSSEAATRKANNVVYNNNVKIQNNYEASKSSTASVKRATGG